MTGSLLRVLLAVAGLTLALLAVPEPRVAPAVAVSLAGRPSGSDRNVTGGALVDAAFGESAWVPGDRRSTELLLRNNTERPVRYALSVSLERASLGGTTQDSTTQDSTSQDSTSQDSTTKDRAALDDALVPTVTVAGDELPANRRVELPELAAGEQRRVQLTIGLPAATDNATQAQTTPIRIRVAAAQPDNHSVTGPASTGRRAARGVGGVLLAGAGAMLSAVWAPRRHFFPPPDHRQNPGGRP